MSQDELKIAPLPKKWLIGLAIACTVFFLAEFSYTKYAHSHVHYEEQFGFYAIAAVTSAVALALICMLLRPVLRRDRSYYDG